MRMSHSYPNCLIRNRYPCRGHGTIRNPNTIALSSRLLTVCRRLAGSHPGGRYRRGPTHRPRPHPSHLPSALSAHADNASVLSGKPYLRAPWSPWGLILDYFGFFAVLPAEACRRSHMRTTGRATGLGLEHGRSARAVSRIPFFPFRRVQCVSVLI